MMRTKHLETWDFYLIQKKDHSKPVKAVNAYNNNVQYESIGDKDYHYKLENILVLSNYI